MEELKKRLEERESEIEIKNKLIKSKSEEIEQLKKELDDVKAITDGKSIQQYEDKFNKLEERIQAKDDRINNLEKNIKQTNELLSEYKDYKDKYDLLEKESNTLKTGFEELKDEKVELEKINKELKFKVENMEERLAREIKALKEVHQKELEEVKEIHSQKVQSLKKKLTPARIYLKYANTQFIRVMNQPTDGIYLILDEGQKKWILDYSAEKNLIERKTAERQARGIAKTGFVVGGNRVGIGFDLILASEASVPEALLREQHKYKE